MTKLEKIRTEKNLTQKFMATNINVSIGCYNMYENSQRKIPRDKAEAIAELLECKVDDIFMPSNFTNCEIRA